MDFDDRRRELEELAFIDESADYEIDQTSLCWDSTSSRLVLLRATGCSCWEGEHTESYFDLWEDLQEALLGDDQTGGIYLSLRGAQQLIAEALPKLTVRMRAQAIVLNAQSEAVN